MGVLKKNFNTKYNSVATKTTFEEDSTYKECVFKSEFFGIPIREKFIVNDGYLVTSSEWLVDQPFSIPVHIPTGIFKFQFELEGYSGYRSEEGDIEIEADHFNFFYLPEVKGSLNYHKKRKVFEIMFDRADFLIRFDRELSLSKDFGQAIKNAQPAILFKQSKRITPELKRMIFSLMNCPLHEDLKSTYIENKVREVLLTALDYSDHYKEDKSYDTNLSDDEKLIQIKSLIDNEVIRHANLSELSRKFGLNEFKLKNGFKKHYGISIMKYIKEIQLDKAYHLLAEGQHSVNEVSAILHYQYPQHFTMAFKKRYGITPSSLNPNQAVKP